MCSHPPSSKDFPVHFRKVDAVVQENVLWMKRVLTQLFSAQQHLAFLLVSACCDTAQAKVFLLVSVCCDTAQALVFLLVSACCDTAQA